MTNYTTRSAKDFLDQPIEVLKLSDEFKEVAQINHFQTLSEMIELPIEVLGKMEQFNHRIMAEYISFMEENGFGHMIEN
ncbi:hypothetical protein [Reichenbachiella ulvae]|uniref:Uncharacterized protein n=1 Tax=Reichenbachiella ulvae TaxID=2980104 RepID=A0ABT3CW09_9BACT|nr:hypothetical protein [Reichenbachiella ulvae]MCV9387890.1 hypothetical protein [Reichenbachiella ulvae]